MMGFGYSRDVAEHCIRLASELGYDGIEFWKQYLDHADLQWTREECKRRGLEILQVCPYFDFTTSSASSVETLNEADRFIHYAREVGAKYIRTYTGRTPSRDASDAQWDRAVTGIQTVAERAALEGVSLMLETHQVIHGGACLVDTSPNTLRMLNLIDRPNVDLALQLPLVGEAPEFTAIQLGGKAVQVQAHNWIGATEESWGELTFLDSGEHDFAAFMRVMKSQGFDGWVSIEHANHHPWEETAAHEANYLRRLMIEMSK